MMNNPDINIFSLRIGIAFLFVYAAYRNGKDKASLQWTVENTKPLFSNTRFAKNLSVIKLFAYGGIAIMYVGGISILIGVEARLGAFLLLIFTVGGTIIHRHQKNYSRIIAGKNQPDSELSSVAWSAFAAHFANILKNVAFILILCFVILNGVGKYQVSDCISEFFNKN